MGTIHKRIKKIGFLLNIKNQLWKRMLLNFLYKLKKLSIR